MAAGFLPAISPATWQSILIGCLLAIVTLAVYWPVRGYDFVYFDDPPYVIDNAHVRQGLTWEGIRWAFTSWQSTLWLPLVWLSYMVDVEWHGLDPGGFHLTNLLIHAAGSVLLFVLLAQLTGSRYRSGWVAAMFALHPLRVESVAWITERKDVLCGFFMMLTLLAYLRYVRSHARGGRCAWYGLTAACFAFGLMAKPMLVTLPCVMLLLDYWPLGRSATTPWRRLVIEKLLFFLLAAVDAVITSAAGERAKVSLEQLTFSLRLSNALVAYATYLSKMVWPVDLACFYPQPDRWPLGIVVASGLVVAAITALALVVRRSCPAVWVGWCWYLGTLVPVLGFVKIGGQAFADRFTYIPLIGAWIAIAWGACELFRRSPWGQKFLAAAAMATIVAAAVGTSRQLPLWQNSLTLFEHALATTGGSTTIHNNLGKYLADRGRLAEALDHYRQSLEIDPGDTVALTNLGSALATRGKLPEAIDHYSRALQTTPASAETLTNLGNALAKLGRTDEAVARYAEALRLQPDNVKLLYSQGNALRDLGKLAEAEERYGRVLQLDPGHAEAYNGLGVTLVKRGRTAAAIERFSAAVKARPGYADAYANRGNALLQTGQAAAALADYQTALKFEPDSPAAMNNLAWLQGTAAEPPLRDTAAALRLAERAVELTDRKIPEYLDTLAGVQAAAGRVEEAVATADEAVAVAEAAGRRNLAEQISRQRERYRGGKP